MKTVSMIILALLCLTGVSKSFEMTCGVDGKSTKFINNNVVGMADCARIDLSFESNVRKAGKSEALVKAYKKSLETREGVKILSWEQSVSTVKGTFPDGTVGQVPTGSIIYCEYKDATRTYIETVYISESRKTISGSFSNKRPEDEDLLRETLRTARIEFISRMTLNKEFVGRGMSGSSSNKNYLNTKKKEDEK